MVSSVGTKPAFDHMNDRGKMLGADRIAHCRLNSLTMFVIKIRSTTLSEGMSAHRAPPRIGERVTPSPLDQIGVAKAPAYLGAWKINVMEVLNSVKLYLICNGPTHRVPFWGVWNRRRTCAPTIGEPELMVVSPFTERRA